MNNNIDLFVERIFESTTQTTRILELKEELKSNLNEKYNDLIADNNTPDQAFNKVVDSVGDVKELIHSAESDPFDFERTKQDKSKIAIMVCISIVLFVASIVSTAILDELDMEILAMTSFFGLATAGVCVLIFTMMSGKVYKSKKDTVVESFKEWNSVSQDSKRIFSALSSILWLFITIVYFVTSFMFGIWAVSWIIFLVGALAQCILQLVLFSGDNFDSPTKNDADNVKSRKGSLMGIYWISVVIVYFVMSFTLDNWAVSWIIFLIAVLVMQILRVTLGDRNEKK